MKKVEATKHNAELLSGVHAKICLVGSSAKHQHGFTLVELITVVVILGIISVVAIPRFFDRAEFDSRAFHDQVISTLRYAQKAAIAQHRFVCVTFTTNSIGLSNSVGLTYGTNSNCTVGAGVLASPSGAPYPSSTQSNFAPAPTNFSFDCLGKPRDMTLATGICGNTLAVLAENLTVQVNNTDAITIWRETGYVR